MAKDRLTEVTKGPVRRTVTIIGLVAAALALIMTIAMVVVALGGFPSSVLRVCFLVWVLSLYGVRVTPLLEG